MTCVVAFSDGKTVWMAGDSFCGDDSARDACRDPKVYTVGALGVGLCGFVRQEVILEKTLRRLITPPDDSEVKPITVTHEWIKFELPDILEKEMKERHATVDKEEQSTLGNSMYMLAFDGRIYYIDIDFGIWEPSGKIAAIGAGRYYALGALEAMLRTDSFNGSPRELLTTSLDVAGKWSPWVSKPYTYIEVG